MEPVDYFLNPEVPLQKHYEALRTFYVEKYTANKVAELFRLSPSYFKKLRFNFCSLIRKGQNPFFQEKKRGPKNRFTKTAVIEEIIVLRKQNYSILDIKAVLDSKDKKVSLDTIDNILKKEGFKRLPRRTRIEKISTTIPSKIIPPICRPLILIDQSFSTEKGAGPLIFLPLIEELGIVSAIRKSGFPSTSILSDVTSLLSFIALKILGSERLSHDETWNLDRALGLFAELNVLPKTSTLSSYSYRVTWSENKKLLIELSRIFQDSGTEQGEFNLDFKSIPHWGDESVLEKNWSGSRTRRIKSILSLIVNDPSTGFLSYTKAGIKRADQNDCIIDFIDFWKEGRGVAPKMLIFDSKFTSYKNLDKLNQSKDKIKFLTLRRRGKNLVSKIMDIPESKWQIIHLEDRKHEFVKAHDCVCKLRDYTGEVRQVIIKDNGRNKPAFLSTNDFTIPLKMIVKKYARRWLVEKEIAEQIAFFHLNNPSSSIVVKVDFDLTLSLLVHNLYKILSNKLPGFERCSVPTIYRSFIENGAEIKIENKNITVSLKKKTHLPILFELPWMKQKTKLSWMDATIEFNTSTFS
jgi:hypothetical protein